MLDQHKWEKVIISVQSFSCWIATILWWCLINNHEKSNNNQVRLVWTKTKFTCRWKVMISQSSINEFQTQAMNQQVVIRKRNIPESDSCSMEGTICFQIFIYFSITISVQTQVCCTFYIYQIGKPLFQQIAESRTLFFYFTGFFSHNCSDVDLIAATWVQPSRTAGYKTWKTNYFMK